MPKGPVEWSRVRSPVATRSVLHKPRTGGGAADVLEGIRINTSELTFSLHDDVLDCL